MKRAFSIAGMFVFLCTISGCGGDSHESLTKESLNLTNEMVDILETVKDEDSAKAAKSKLEDVTKRMEDLKKRMDKIGKPTKEQEKELQKKYGDEVEKLMGRLRGIRGKMTQFSALKGIKSPF